MDKIRLGDAWRVTLQTQDTSGNSQAPDSAIDAGDIRVYVNGTPSAVAASVATLADIVGGHAISWPNATTARGDHLRMQVAFTIDAVDYEARFEALVEADATAAEIRTELDSNSTQLAAIAGVTAKVDTALEDDGDSGFQFTQLAIANVPAAINADATQTTLQTNAATAATQATAAATSAGTAATQAAQAVLNSDAAAVAAVAAAADALTANTQTKPTAIRAAVGLDAADLTTVLDTITASAAASAAAAAAVQELVESDQILEDVSGVRKLKFYRKGTSVELITAKTAKQPDGTDLTDPTTERLAGYRE